MGLVPYSGVGEYISWYLVNRTAVLMEQRMVESDNNWGMLIVWELGGRVEDFVISVH